MSYSLMIYTADKRPLKSLPFDTDRYELALMTARRICILNSYIWKITRLSDGIILSCSSNYIREKVQS